MDAVKAFDCPFELKGSLFTLTVLYLQQADLAAIEHHLADKVSQAPGFFKNVPVVIDLNRLEQSTVLDFRVLYGLLRDHGLIPVATRTGDESLLRAAAAAGLPSLPSREVASYANEDTAKSPKPAKDEEPSAAKTERRGGRFHGQPVRSGQQIYSQGGDLTIVGTVSPGAEVLADGSIHIYGALRGRALAGVKGDCEARIFCQSLEAELVSIAGNYRVFEEVNDVFRDKLTQAYLEQDKLIIEPLAR